MAPPKVMGLKGKCSWGEEEEEEKGLFKVKAMNEVTLAQVLVHISVGQ